MKSGKIKNLIINLSKIKKVFTYVKVCHKLFYINTILVFCAALFESFSISLVLPILKNLEDQNVDKSFIEKSFEYIFNQFNIDYTTLNLLIFFTICQLIKYSFVFSQLHMSRVLSATVTKELREQTTNKLINKEISYFDKNDNGNSISTIFISTQSTGASLEYLTLLIKSLVFSIVYLAIAASISFKLTLLTLFIVIISYYFLINVFQKSEELGILEKKITDNSISYLADKLQGIRVMKIYQLEQLFLKDLKLKYKDFAFNSIKLMDNKILSQLLFEPILFIIFVLVLMFNITLSFIPLNTLIVLVFIFILVIPQLKMVNSQIVTINSLFGHFNKVFELIETHNKKIRKNLSKFEKFKNEIVFKDVSFSYTKDSDYILNKLNIKFPANETTYIVGKSGSGKSSIINLLLKFYEPSSGNIYIDGINLSKIEKKIWLSNISYVDQLNYLFNETVDKNILFGNQAAGNNSLQIVKKDAQISNLNNNIENENQKIGSRGTKLSGGQRQRIALARAMIRNSDILILDEATSELDINTERLIQQAIHKIQNKKTLIVVAHKLDLIKKAKNIIFIDDGYIYENGSFNELINNKSRFYDFFKNHIN